MTVLQAEIYHLLKYSHHSFLLSFEHGADPDQVVWEGVVFPFVFFQEENKLYQKGLLNYVKQTTLKWCIAFFSLLLPGLFSQVTFLVIVSKTKADKTFTSLFYHDRARMFREVYKEKQSNFNVDFSMKYIPTEGADKVGVEGNIGAYYNKTSSLTTILDTSTEKVSLIGVQGLLWLFYCDGLGS